MSYLIISLTQVFFINLQKIIQKTKIKDKNTSELEPNFLAQESSSALASLRNTFFFIFGLLSFLINSMYLSLIQIRMPPNNLLISSFILNDH